MYYYYFYYYYYYYFYYFYYYYYSALLMLCPHVVRVFHVLARHRSCHACSVGCRRNDASRGLIKWFLYPRPRAALGNQQ